jgi:hypothetical protein
VNVTSLKNEIIRLCNTFSSQPLFLSLVWP